MTSIYLVGSLRNPNVPEVANKLRAAGYDVFSSWFCAGEVADDRWQEHEKGRGLTLKQALKDYAAQHVYEFDKQHLDRCDMAVLVMPAGKSGHLEIGYMAGNKKPTFVLFDKEPERWDVMLNFCTDIAFSVEELAEEIRQAEISIWPYTKAEPNSVKMVSKTYHFTENTPYEDWGGIIVCR